MKLNEALSLKVIYLRTCVPPDDIRLLVLDLPRDYYDDISLSYPEPFLHFSWDSDYSSDAIQILDLYPIGPKEALYVAEDLPILFAR